MKAIQTLKDADVVSCRSMLDITSVKDKLEKCESVDSDKMKMVLEKAQCVQQVNAIFDMVTQLKMLMEKQNEPRTTQIVDLSETQSQMSRNNSQYLEVFS